MTEYRLIATPYRKDYSGKEFIALDRIYFESSEDLERLTRTVEEYATNKNELLNVKNTFDAAYVKLSVEKFSEQSKSWILLIEDTAFCA